MKKQSGFTLVETLLVILTAAVIGLGGWWVWHSQHKTTTPSSQPSANTSSVKSNKLVFTQFGVQITVPAFLEGLAYHATDIDGVTYLDVYTPAFEDALHKCDPTTASSTTAPFISLSKVSGQYNQNDNPGVGNLKQFSSFWISGATPNGIVCADSASQQDKDNFEGLFNSSNTTFRAAFDSATLVQ